MSKRVKTTYDRGYVNAMDKIRVFIESNQKVMYIDTGEYKNAQSARAAYANAMPHGHSLLRMEKCVASAPSRTLRMRLVTFGYKVVVVIFYAVSTIVKAAAMWQVIG